MNPDDNSPNPAEEMAKNQAEASAIRFARLASEADIKVVGKDHEYVPDGPHAREGHPNLDESGDDSQDE